MPIDKPGAVKSNLTLDDHDARVIAAKKAEDELFDFYGLQSKTSYVTLPGSGIRIRVCEFGNGEPIVVVPGNTGDVFPLAPLLAELKGRRIIAINRPGGGLSEGFDHNTVNIREFAVKTLTTVLDSLGLDSVPVLAHSMGAHWSFWLAMDEPSRVSALVTLGNPGNVMLGQAPLIVRLLARPPWNRLFFRLMTSGTKESALKGLTFMGHDAKMLAQLPVAMADCYYYFRRLPHYRVSILSLLENAAPRIGEEDLARVHQPVMLLWGTKDSFADVEIGRKIAVALPAGTLHSLEGAGHLPWLESSPECGKLILEFLREK